MVAGVVHPVFQDKLTRKGSVPVPGDVIVLAGAGNLSMIRIYPKPSSAIRTVRMAPCTETFIVITTQTVTDATFGERDTATYAYVLGSSGILGWLFTGLNGSGEFITVISKVDGYR
jgi:hypothetical protein